MPSASPASVTKRPSIHERSASGHSLSSSAKQQQHIHKVHRPHLVGRHSRNVSHGKNLGKLNRVDSGANIAKADRNHQRKKSGASTPGQSPKSPGLMKRNSSHVTLTKNTSHGNLRKNHSATLLTSTRHGSNVNLKRQGLPPTPQQKQENPKTGFFELGDDAASGNEEEAEWEDSTTQSPELTRNNSKTNSKSSTPARVATPDVSDTGRKTSEVWPSRAALVPKTANRSLPNLQRQHSDESSHQDPDLLVQARRGSRAPPAISTVSAVAGLNRSESKGSFQNINHSEAASMQATPSMSVGETSADKAVSRFLNEPSTSSEVKSMIDDASDDESATFLNNYKPLPSESPEKPRNTPKARFSTIPSRTQQRLELERREQLRATGGPATPPATTLTMGGPSSLSLHSRSGSRGRTRSYIDDSKAIKFNYAAGVRQLTVVRRFRNPMVESFSRLKDAGSVPADAGVATPKGAASTKNRPPSRRGGPISSIRSGNAGLSSSLGERDKEPSPLASRSSSRGPGNRAHSHRQGSHDDIGVTPREASQDGADEDDGLTPDEALMRRLWDSREIYDASAVSTP